MSKRNIFGHYIDSMPVRQRVANNILNLMKVKGLNISQLAFNSGMSNSHTGAILRCTNNPSLETLSQIANALGVPITELVVEHHADAPKDYCR